MFFIDLLSRFFHEAAESNLSAVHAQHGYFNYFGAGLDDDFLADGACEYEHFLSPWLLPDAASVKRHEENSCLRCSARWACLPFGFRGTCGPDSRPRLSADTQFSRSTLHWRGEASPVPNLGSGSLPRPLVLAWG